MTTLCRNLARQRGCSLLSRATSMSTGSASFQRPSLSHNGHKTIAPTRAFTVNLVKFRGPLDWGSPKSSSARDSPRSTSDASRSNKSSRDYDRDYDRPSSSRSYDSFDRLSDGKGSGKFGRPSFGQQKSDSFRPRESSLNNSSRDGHSDDSYKRTSSYTSTSGGENGRDYDPFVSRRSNLPSQNKSPDHDYLYSPNVVISALHNTLRTPYTLYYSSTVLQNRKKLKADPVSDCIKAAKDAGVKIIKTTKHELNELADQRPHQGVILEASKLPHIFVKALGPVSDQNQYQLISKSGETMFRCREKEPPVWIALDEVVDPQNLGAILRTALFLGVDGVIVCHKNSSPLSAVVAKASVGALEVRPTYGVSSLMRFIQDSQKNGWHVVGAHVTFGSKRSRPLHTWPDTGVDQPTLLVMGSEGNGLRKQIMNQCDSFIQVPSLGTAVSNVDSLNVSVATGIILSKLMGGRFLSLPKNLKKFPLRHLTPGNYDETVLDKNDDNWGEEEEEEEEEEEGGDDDDDADDDEDDAADTKSAGSKKPLPF